MTKQESIGFLLLAESFGGAERRYLRLCQRLAENGTPVTVFCNTLVPVLAAERGILLESVTVVDLGYSLADPESRGLRSFFSRIFRLRSWFAFLGKVRKNNISHLHVVAGPGRPLFFISLFSWLLPKFSFSIFGSKWVDLGQKHNRVELWALWLGLRTASRIDCLTPSYQVFAKSKISKIHHDKVVLAPGSFTDFSKVQEVGNRDVDVVFLARFVEGKGLRLLSQIWPSLNAQGITLHVCGFGPLQSEAPGPHVYEVEDSFALLARAKIFLSIQEKDNYPSQSLLEAMASGCAIVATDVGNTRLMVDEQVAIMVAPDSNSIRSAIERLISSPAHAQALGVAASQRIRERFTIEQYASYFSAKVLDLPQLGPTKMT